MKKVLVSVAVGAVAVAGGLIPASGATLKETKTTVVTNGVAVVEAKGSDAYVSGEGVAWLKKNGDVVKTRLFNFKKNEIGGSGGIAYFDPLYKDLDGPCTLVVKYKGNDKFEKSSDSYETKCRKPKG